MAPGDRTPSSLCSVFSGYFMISRKKALGGDNIFCCRMDLLEWSNQFWACVESSFQSLVFVQIRFSRQDKLLLSFFMEDLYKNPRSLGWKPVYYSWLQPVLLTQQHLHFLLILLSDVHFLDAHVWGNRFCIFVFNSLNNYLSFHLSFSQREETSPKLPRGFPLTGRWMKGGHCLSSVILVASQQVRRSSWLAI